MPKEIDPKKVVILSGAGISAESGIRTFRDSDGLWNEYAISEVASPKGWDTNPQLVLDFYNQRRDDVRLATPNLAHEAIANLQNTYEVVVITQNIDDLHERAGSEHVIHIHGEILKARSSTNSSLVYELENKNISIGEVCSEGSQLRPHIVWFGEKIMHDTQCREHLKTAGKVLIVGTSLSVYPAANLAKLARYNAEKFLVGLDVDKKLFGYTYYREKATKAVPIICQGWINGAKEI